MNFFRKGAELIRFCWWSSRLTLRYVRVKVGVRVTAALVEVCASWCFFCNLLPVWQRNRLVLIARKVTNVRKQLELCCGGHCRVTLYAGAIARGINIQKTGNSAVSLLDFCKARSYTTKSIGIEVSQF